MANQEKPPSGETHGVTMPERIDFARYPDGSPAYLDSLRRKKLKSKDLDDIIRICNQPEIKRWLFRRLLGESEYTLDSADFWIDKADNGWKIGESFVYVIRDYENSIVGSVDIKSNDTNGSEIGYWASNNSRGYITNATHVLAEEAKKAGYKRLFALIEKGNQKSENVLKRLEFKYVKDSKDKFGDEHKLFEKVLV